VNRLSELTALLGERMQAHRARDHAPYIIAVTGSVAVGKSTLATQIRDALAPDNDSALVLNTDGFLFSNAVLQERNLSLRKGYPETYDLDALRAAVSAIKNNQRIEIPRYSHVTYDVDHDNPIAVEGAALIVLDGLHLGSIGGDLVDTLLYLDASEAVIENWFSTRLLTLMLQGRNDPESFYHRFRAMDDTARGQFITMVWRDINLPNLRNHIIQDRTRADIVARKSADHKIEAIALR
jgi:type I pantothenate kinase